MFSNRNESPEESFDSHLQNVPEIIFECQDGQALQLVRINGNSFEIVKETMDILQQVQGNVAFVSIVGKYRTGKSFL
jgi:hypothetical protein